MHTRLMKLVLAAALVCGANVAYAMFNPAEAGTVQGGQCSGDCNDTSACGDNCVCFPAIGHPSGLCVAP